MVIISADCKTAENIAIYPHSQSDEIFPGSSYGLKIERGRINTEQLE